MVSSQFLALLGRASYTFHADIGYDAHMARAFYGAPWVIVLDDLDGADIRWVWRTRTATSLALLMLDMNKNRIEDGIDQLIFDEPETSE